MNLSAFDGRNIGRVENRLAKIVLDGPGNYILLSRDSIETTFCTLFILFFNTRLRIFMLHTAHISKAHCD